ncbi:carbohydrate porin [Burkholderia sp. Ac-20379]|nr:carbohydrate porin [Burkholderia sp. Ac-20379]
MALAALMASEARAAGGIDTQAQADSQPQSQQQTVQETQRRSQGATAAQAPEADLAIQAAPSNFFTGFWTRQNALGDMGGLRPWLGKYGVNLQVTEVSEYLANVRGGLHRGGEYDGLTTATVTVDTSKALGWTGGLFNVSGLQIHGRNLSADNLGTLNTASGIEAQGTTRLWELWFQQSFMNKRFDIKVGQQSIDQEFISSSYAATFVNTMFGWPALPSYDMPSGGPAYPLSALGVRVRAQITPSLTALAGVFDGDPLGNDANNLHGTNFNLHNGTLMIGELQYSINQPSDGELVSADNSHALPGTYKLGVWYNNGRFDDLNLDNTGRSLADAASSGTALSHRGDYSFYAVADQMIWRPDPDEPRSIGVFARVMGAPGDRNLVSLSANLGIVMKAPFAHRDNDSMGLALTYVKVGSHAHDLDLAYRAQGGPYGVRTSETALEATYIYQVTPWWQIQGDAQYTFNAGAGQNPSDATQPLRNTFVIGARTTITF